MYARLPPDDQEELLRRRCWCSCEEKNFEGAGGLEMTDEIRATIAAQACILLLRRDDDDSYPQLRSIVVYPSAYRVLREQARVPLTHAGEAVDLGESWQHAPWRGRGTARAAAPPTRATGRTRPGTSSRTSWTRKTAPPTARRSWTAWPFDAPWRGC